MFCRPFVPERGAAMELIVVGNELNVAALVGLLTGGTWSWLACMLCMVVVAYMVALHVCLWRALATARHLRLAAAALPEHRGGPPSDIAAALPKHEQQAVHDIS